MFLNHCSSSAWRGCCADFITAGFARLRLDRLQRHPARLDSLSRSRNFQSISRRNRDRRIDLCSIGTQSIRIGRHGSIPCGIRAYPVRRFVDPRRRPMKVRFEQRRSTDRTLPIRGGPFRIPPSRFQQIRVRSRLLACVKPIFNRSVPTDIRSG